MNSQPLLILIFQQFHVKSRWNWQLFQSKWWKLSSTDFIFHTKGEVILLSCSIHINFGENPSLQVCAIVLQDLINGSWISNFRQVVAKSSIECLVMGIFPEDFIWREMPFFTFLQSFSWRKKCLIKEKSYCHKIRWCDKDWRMVVTTPPYNFQ